MPVSYTHLYEQGDALLRDFSAVVKASLEKDELFCRVLSLIHICHFARQGCLQQTVLRSAVVQRQMNHDILLSNFAQV